MSTRRAFSLAVVVASAAVIAPIPAGAQAGSSEVTSLEASHSGTSIAVSGSATFVDVPVVVGEDPEGDVLVPAVGTDLTAATIARPNPAGSTLTFTLDIADQPPVVGGTPEVVHYNWDVSVNGGPAFTLQAIRTGQWAQPGAGPVFRILSCSEGSCSSAASVSGTMADGIVQWQVPMFRIGATDGNLISQGGGLVSTLGASGLVWFVDLGGDSMFHEDYRVPAATVELGIADASVPDELVALTTQASASASTGSFSASLPAPVEGGTYKVVAKACFGSQSCGIAATTMTI